jgi:hypothetical protein
MSEKVTADKFMEHPLIVIGGTAGNGNPSKLFIVNFACQMFLNIIHALV